QRQLAGGVTWSEVEDSEDYERYDEQRGDRHEDAAHEELRHGILSTLGIVMQEIGATRAVAGAGHGPSVTGAALLLYQSARYQSAMFHSSESHEFLAVPRSVLALAETSER